MKPNLSPSESDDISIDFKSIFEEFMNDIQDCDDSANQLDIVLAKYVRILTNTRVIKRSEGLKLALIPYTDITPTSLFLKSLEDEYDCRILRLIILILTNMFEDWIYRAKVFRFIVSLGCVTREDFIKIFKFDKVREWRCFIV